KVTHGGTEKLRGQVLPFVGHSHAPSPITGIAPVSQPHTTVDHRSASFVRLWELSPLMGGTCGLHAGGGAEEELLAHAFVGRPQKASRRWYSPTHRCGSPWDRWAASLR